MITSLDPLLNLEKQLNRLWLVTRLGWLGIGYLSPDFDRKNELVRTDKAHDGIHEYPLVDPS